MPEQGKSVPGERKPNLGPSAGPSNRKALIAAAREIFAEQGFDAPLNAIVKRAGVGQGSLYRHFPDRLELGLAVFDENLDALEGVAAEPDASLARLLDTIIDQALVSTGLIDLIWRHRRDERVEHIGARLRTVIVELLERDRAAGRIGGHVGAADVELAVTMLADVVARSDPAERQIVARRARNIFRAAFAPRPDQTAVKSVATRSSAPGTSA
ncbi:TetR/AcrR family transcriptional regulator [Agromyces protaetiae]|uniref:TetR/AcrR family transcriptional regulator n=1 Tax=Agromyces protaetiae TaxID=2509455 RepID=A0A4P6FPU7_9MICO|nr:TetR/AcrR family transcriptional regulator [Agromyces protaetiae]QAY72538.1 TetR/AcrR family transcriptional regulator [Agromyces protaetiae]